jgi:hypothetical protein
LTDKDFSNHKKKPLASLVRILVENLENESRTQLDYHGNLKSRVHSGRFIQHVYLTLQSKSNGEPCLLNLRWDYMSVQNGVPAGSMVTPKYRFIQDLRKEYSDEMAEGDYDREYKGMRDIIHPPGCRTNKFSFLNECSLAIYQ